MRPLENSGNVRRRRWPLCLVALLCFGPLAPILLMGFIFVPFWLQMLSDQLAHPENYQRAGAGSIWGSVWPIGVVLAGLVGYAGLLWLLALRPDSSIESRRVIRVFIFVGLAGLVGLDWPIFGLASVGELLGDGLVGFAVYVVLPLVGATWIRSATWSELFPGR